MATDNLLFSKKEHVAYITLNRPEHGNKIDLPLSQELTDICHQINGDQDIYITVVSGTGEQFCSGAELSEPKTTLPLAGNPVEALASLNCPTIAAINGDAIAEGLELALACDIRIASESARFGLPQITRGLIPMNGGTQRLSRIIGKGKALEMVLTGFIIDAPEAFADGLVNKLVSRDKLMSEVEILTKSLAAKAPFALRYCKEAINKGLDVTLDQGLRLEADLYFLLHTTADRTEGIQSFVQKRPPQYNGR
jgi:enoyl-CoA hydratase/carnithine racemase